MLTETKKKIVQIMGEKGGDGTGSKDWWLEDPNLRVCQANVEDPAEAARVGIQ